MNLLHKKSAVIIAALLVLMLWPTEYLASPRWDVQVLNQLGKPLNGASVRLVYVDYSVESKSHEVTLQADENGCVAFPSVHRRANLLQRGIHTALAAMAGVHASFGRHAYVFAFGTHEGDVVENGYVYDWQGSPASIQSKIVAK